METMPARERAVQIYGELCDRVGVGFQRSDEGSGFWRRWRWFPADMTGSTHIKTVDGGDAGKREEDGPNLWRASRQSARWFPTER